MHPYSIDSIALIDYDFHYHSERNTKKVVGAPRRSFLVVVVVFPVDRWSILDRDSTCFVFASFRRIKENFGKLGFELASVFELSASKRLLFVSSWSALPLCMYVFTENEAEESREHREPNTIGHVPK